jgi:hypothetical protein
MANITNWTWYVSSMYTVKEIPNKPDYVAMVTWRLIGSDGVNKSDVGNNAVFEEISSDADFVPFENLTEEMVLGWVKTQLGEEGITFYKAQAQAEIDVLSAPVITPEFKPLPWSNEGASL